MSGQAVCAPDSEANGKQNIIWRQWSAAALNNTTTHSAAACSVWSNFRHSATRNAGRTVDSKDPDRDPAAGWHAAATGSSSIGRWSSEAPGPTSRRRVQRITFADPPGIVSRDSGAPQEAALHHAGRDLSGVTGARYAGCAAGLTSLSASSACR